MTGVKRYFAFIVMILSSLSASAAAEEWKQVNGEHFIVYFVQDEGFARKVEEKAEVYYGDIAYELGYPRYKEFWLWDKRVKIFIYPDHASFLKATGQPGWSQGMADYKHKRILSYAWSENFLDSLLPHEMAHLIFRDFVGFEGEVPLWLDEGVAQWAEKVKRAEMKDMVKRLYQNDALLSLNDLTTLDVRNIRDKNKVYIRITHTKDGKETPLIVDADNLVDIYYLESFSLVGFLIEKYGSDNFAYFCRQLRDGKALEEALRFTYPTHIRNLDDLEQRWRSYLRQAN